MQIKALLKHQMAVAGNPYARIERCAMGTKAGCRKAAEASPREVIVPCKYKVGRVLGKGTYAEVKEMIHIGTGKRFAGKVINRERMGNGSNLVQNEIHILKKLSRKHPNLLTLVDYFSTPRNTYLITELCEGGELFEYIHRRLSLGEAEASHIVRQTVEGVAFLHAHGIMHRDLKTENCLVRTDASGAPTSVVIADFGMAHLVPEGNSRVVTNVCGTPGYMAPEMIQRAGHGKPVDMWAVGVMTYFMLSGMNPFQRQNRSAEFRAIVSGCYEFAPAHRWAGVSRTARDFIASLLVVDPAHRLTAKEALQHPWLRDCKTDTSRLSLGQMDANSQILDIHCQLPANEDDSLDMASGNRSSSSVSIKDTQPAPFGAGVPACAAGTRHTSNVGAAAVESIVLAKQNMDGIPPSANQCYQKHNQNEACSSEQHKSRPASNHSSQATCIGAMSHGAAEADGRSDYAYRLTTESLATIPKGILPMQPSDGSDPSVTMGTVNLNPHELSKLMAAGMSHFSPSSSQACLALHHHCYHQQRLVCPLTGHIIQMAPQANGTPSKPQIAGHAPWYPAHTPL